MRLFKKNIRGNAEIHVLFSFGGRIVAVFAHRCEMCVHRVFFPEMKQFLSNRRREAHMNWFESSTDWEQELDRCGAAGWRVSSVNDRFEMSTR